MRKDAGENLAVTSLDGKETLAVTRSAFTAIVRRAENRGFDLGWRAAIEETYDTIFMAGAQAALDKLTSEHNGDDRPKAKPAA